MEAVSRAPLILKMKKLLNNIMQPDFRIRSDTNFNLLLSYISGKESSG